MVLLKFIRVNFSHIKSRVENSPCFNITKLCNINLWTGSKKVDIIKKDTYNSPIDNSVGEFLWYDYLKWW